MNDITTLFTTIGDLFTGSDWFSMVQWSFWVLLFTVAAGGVYCARFGKKTLLNQGIAGALNLTVIYLGAAIACIHIPFLRNLLSPLPFLSVTDQGISLASPFTFNLGILAPPLLRLMILVFLVNLVDSFRTGSRSLLKWLLFQLATVLIALVLYAVITAGISLILPALLGLYAIIPVVALIAIGLLVLCGKFLFTVVITGGNSYFSAVNRFFTANRIGALLTVSAVTFLLSVCVLCVLHITGNAGLSYSGINPTGLWIVLAMLHTVLYIFCMFNSERKKT